MTPTRRQTTMPSSRYRTVVAIAVAVAAALAAQAFLPEASVLLRAGLTLGTMFVLLVIMRRQPTPLRSEEKNEPEPSLFCAEAHGIEWDWFACDDVGHVALISSGGSGQVPRLLLAQESAIHDLLAHLDVTLDTDSWQKAAERGFFAYDVDSNGGPFRRVGSPSQPRTLADLPEPHRSLIERAKVRGVFSELRRIETSMVECPPPRMLDGAVVRCWAWSERTPFFVMPDGGDGIPIHGLAICQYESGQIYRFSCDKDWEVVNDTDYESIEQAKGVQSTQYDSSSVRWQDLGIP